MNLANKDLNLLMALRALLEEANVTRAGERLGVGQSTMSVTLSRLRLDFHDELLVRVGREYELTPVARHLLPLVQRAVPLLDEVLGRVAGFDPSTSSRRLTIMVPDYVSVELWPHIEKVLSPAPGVSVDFVPPSDHSGVTDRELLRYDFISTVPAGGIEGESAVLLRDNYVCLVDRDNSRLMGGLLSWDDFRALPQATVEFDQDYRTPADMRLMELGFHRQPAVRVQSYLPLPAIIAGTDLVAVVPSRLVRRLGQSTGTIGVPLPFQPIEVVESLWWHPSRKYDPAHEWFRTELFEHLNAA